MRKQNIIRLLQKADPEQISKEYPGLTDARKEELFGRIEQSFQNVPEEDAEDFTVIEESHFSRTFQTAAAAVCMLALAGTFAGLYYFKNEMQPATQPEPTESLHLGAGRAYAVGERYAAENLTQSGTLWMTVTEAEAEGDLYRVEVLLESEKAVSVADAAMGEPYLFMADNFMAAKASSSKYWLTVQPYAIAIDGKQGDLPYTIHLRPGKSCGLTLWFKASELPDEWELVTSYSAAYSYTVITMKEE